MTINKRHIALNRAMTRDWCGGYLYRNGALERIETSMATGLTAAITTASPTTRDIYTFSLLGKVMNYCRSMVGEAAIFPRIIDLIIRH